MKENTMRGIAALALGALFGACLLLSVPPTTWGKVLDAFPIAFLIFTGFLWFFSVTR